MMRKRSVGQNHRMSEPITADSKLEGLFEGQTATNGSEEALYSTGENWSAS
jgi:hypothetical protein